LIIFAEERSEKSQGNRKKTPYKKAVFKNLAVCTDTAQIITKETHEKLHDNRERHIGRLAN
jgi:hypothetical protein